MSKKDIEKIRKKIEPILDKAGYEIFNIEYKDNKDDINLTIYIDNEEDNITLKDCEKVNGLLDIPFDELDITNGRPYTVNIFSPGIDRPLLREKDYIRNKGKNVDIKTYGPIIDKKRKIKAKLLSFDDEMIVVEFNKKEIKILKKDIASIRQAIEF